MRCEMENIIATILVLAFVGTVMVLVDTYFESTRKWGENFRRKR